MKPSTFTAEVDPSLAKKLETDLLEQGFEISRPPYTIFSAKKQGISCTFYESGKLVVQGKEMKSFIEFYLEPEILQEFHFSHPMADLDKTPRIGMDEAGKGDFFGPLCVAALYADGPGIEELLKLGVKDSKLFSDEPLVKLARKIRAAFPHCIIRLFPEKYNELYGRFKNLNRLLAWAHAAAVADVSQKTHCRKAILDQFTERPIVKEMLLQKRIEIDVEQKVRAEADPVVAAASILARASFLEGLEILGQEIGEVLPKGASAGVISAGVKLVKQRGPLILEKVGKSHFKTKGDILARVSEN